MSRRHIFREFEFCLCPRTLLINFSASGMPTVWVIRNTDPKVTLYIHTPQTPSAILPLSFNAAIIDGYQHLLEMVAYAQGNIAIPPDGLTSTVGHMTLEATSLNPSAGLELDCGTLGKILNSIWTLISKHGYKTWNFDVYRAAGVPTVIDSCFETVSILYHPNSRTDTP